MQIVKLYQDYGIPIASEGQRHYRNGWVNTPCPLCTTKHPGNHLGYNLYDGYFKCWLCGWHSEFEVIKVLTDSKNNYETIQILKKYNGNTQVKINKPVNRIVKPKILQLPTDISELNKYQRQYLINRKFDPDKLIKEWGIKGLGTTSVLEYKDKENKDYSNRIFIPIYWDNKMVSFQGRTLSPNSILRYKTCPLDIEIIHHKHILYGSQAYWGKTGVIVEGVTDVWRLGKKSCATFGTSIKSEQLRILMKRFKRIAIVLDPDNAGINKAKKMLSEFKFFGIDAFRVKTDTDAGSMLQEDADYLIKEITKEII